MGKLRLRSQILIDGRAGFDWVRPTRAAYPIACQQRFQRQNRTQNIQKHDC